MQALGALGYVAGRNLMALAPNFEPAILEALVGARARGACGRDGHPSRDPRVRQPAELQRVVRECQRAQNLATARALGLAFPGATLLRATRVID